MQNKHTQTLNRASVAYITGASLILLLSAVAFQGHPEPDATHPAASAQLAEDGTTICTDLCAIDTGSSSTILHSAELLQQRLQGSGGMVPGVDALVQALTQKQAFLKKSVHITVTDSSQPSIAPANWTVAIADHPELLVLHYTWSSAAYVLDDAALSTLITAQKFEGQKMYVSTVVKTLKTDEKKVQRADGSPVAHDGYQYDPDSIARAIGLAFDRGADGITLDLPYKKATVTYAVDGQSQDLTLLSTGLSDFSDSPEERVWNVHKAIQERVNNVVVPQGQTFSFVDGLNAPVTIEKGWREGLGLFGGGAALTPGAGICQAATTVYRAALLGGFPIVEKKNHSMWVDHYEPFGAGLDATVFPGFHDLRFKNDTDGPLLIQAYIEGTKVTVNIYGIDDHRDVSMDGPYFWNTPNRAAGLAPLGRDQIGWVQKVTTADGKITTKSYIATYYKGIPRKVMTKYANAPGEKIMHEDTVESSSK